MVAFSNNGNNSLCICICARWPEVQDVVTHTFFITQTHNIVNESHCRHFRTLSTYNFINVSIKESLLILQTLNNITLFKLLNFMFKRFTLNANIHMSRE